MRKSLPELVDALEAADDQPLEVELGGDPQVQRAVQRVVVGRERPRERAAVDRLEHRRLDLDEAALVEEAPHRRDHAGARDEQLARLLVGHQVELALAEARLGVGEPVVLLGRRAQRLGQHGDVLEAQRQLAAAGAEDDAVDPDQVAEVERDEPVEGLAAEHVDARVQLQAPRAVDEVEEGGLALPAAGGDPAGDAGVRVGLLAGSKLGERRDDLGDRPHAAEGVREGLDALGAQGLELAPPGRQQLRAAGGLRGRLGHLRRCRSW